MVTAYAATTAITADMLTPVTTAVTDNVGVILPIGITIFGILLGIKLVPRIFSWFINA